MSVSTAAFSDSLRQIPARGLSLLLTLGHLSMEHSPGLSCGNDPAGRLGGFLFTHLPCLECSPCFITVCSCAELPLLHTQSPEPAPGTWQGLCEVLVPSLARRQQ